MMEERYIASMVLAGVGDAMGYKNGDWEFCFDGEKIHSQLKDLGGIKKLDIAKPGWIVSDDTVLLLSTAQALLKENGSSREKLYAELAFQYRNDYFKDMTGRSGGITTSASVAQLRPLAEYGWQIPFNSRGGGCGGAMRSMCIGLRYPNYEDESSLNDLIAVSVESGRMTHNCPTGYLGSFASALFVALSVKEVPLKRWGSILIGLLPKVWDYIVEQGRDVQENLKHWAYFSDQWIKYLKFRNLESGDSDPLFPENYGVKERDVFYKSVSFKGWGGASGHDAPMIAYDALLCAGDDWETLCHHGMLHGGDNDSTGVIAGACFGARYGFKGVPKCNYKRLEYHDRLVAAGKGILKLCEQNTVP